MDVVFGVPSMNGVKSNRRVVISINYYIKHLGLVAGVFNRVQIFNPHYYANVYTYAPKWFYMF